MWVQINFIWFTTLNTVNDSMYKVQKVLKIATRLRRMLTVVTEETDQHRSSRTAVATNRRMPMPAIGARRAFRCRCGAVIGSKA